MSTSRLYQRIRELTKALENCDTQEERDEIEDEIDELQSQLEEEDNSFHGKHDFI